MSNVAKIRILLIVFMLYSSLSIGISNVTIAISGLSDRNDPLIEEEWKVSDKLYFPNESLHRLIDYSSNNTMDNEVNESIGIIDIETLKKKIDESNDFVLLDARGPVSYADGHIVGAISLPVIEAEDKAEIVIPDKFITLKDIKETLSKHNLTVKKGDTVLLYTGHYNRSYGTED